MNDEVRFQLDVRMSGWHKAPANKALKITIVALTLMGATYMSIGHWYAQDAPPSTAESCKALSTREIQFELSVEKLRERIRPDHVLHFWGRRSNVKETDVRAAAIILTAAGIGVTTNTEGVPTRRGIYRTIIGFQQLEIANADMRLPQAALGNLGDQTLSKLEDRAIEVFRVAKCVNSKDAATNNDYGSHKSVRFNGAMKFDLTTNTDTQ